MNNILLIGNGFDLAHGLLTSYNQFLEVMKNWNDIYREFTWRYYGTTFFNKYMCNASEMNENNIKELNEIMSNNSWVKYFKQCEAEIDGWIDFEKEILPVIKLFETIFSIDNYNITGSSTYGQVNIEKKYFNSNQIRIINMWDKYLSSSSDIVSIKESYRSYNYGILKKKISKLLSDEFNEFIRSFEIYLLEFVHKTENIQLLKQIKDINADYVISFNYTHTEELYGIAKENVHHIHGMIREDVNTGINNMVLGLNEQENQNMDFIYFVKYFQRIQKASGVKYKEFVNKAHYDSLGQRIEEDYTLHIYGHSLDETDEDILKYVIGDKDENGKLDLKPKKVIIYYYDSFDYEQKVINLIKLYGRAIVEEYMENGLFEFIPTTQEIHSP